MLEILISLRKQQLLAFMSGHKYVNTVEFNQKSTGKYPNEI